MLLNKYEPRKLSDIIGNYPALKILKDFVLNFKNQRNKAIILYGATGIGKTISVYALAKDYNLEILEVNSSINRNANELQSLVGNAMQQRSLFRKGKIILIDEIDGISGQKDRGGIQALLKLLEKSFFPIVITANEIRDTKFSALRKKCLLVEFKRLEDKEIFSFLKLICEKEKIPFEETALRRLVINSRGDLRSAVLDLESLSGVNNKSLKQLDGREREEDIMQALKIIFKSKDPSIVLGAFNSVNMDLNDCLLWIDENLPREYEQLETAYDFISKTDVFRGRILRNQYWRFLVYQNIFMTLGIALAKEKANKKIVSYKRSERILKIWIAKQRYAKKRAIAEKLAFKMHTSVRKALKEIDYLRCILQKEEIANYLNLNEEEIDWLAK